MSSSSVHPSLGHFLQFVTTSSARRFCDVRIMAAGSGRMFRCHQLVLAAHSPFVKRLLMEAATVTSAAGYDAGGTVITLADTDAAELEAVLRFVYRGQASPRLAAAARMLGLRRADDSKAETGGPRHLEELVAEAASSWPVPESTSPLRQRSRRKKTRSCRLDAEQFDFQPVGVGANVGGEGCQEMASVSARPTKEGLTDEDEEEGGYITWTMDVEAFACCGFEFMTEDELAQHRQRTMCLNDEAVLPEVDIKMESESETTEVPVDQLKRKAASSTQKMRRRHGRQRNASSPAPPLSSLECCDQKFDDELIYTTHKENVHLEQPAGNRLIICCKEKLGGGGTFKLHLQEIHQLDDATDSARCCNVTFEGLPALTRHCTTTHGLKLSDFKRVSCCATKLSSFEEWREHKAKDAAHVECDHCTFLSKDVRNLQLHLYSKHRIGQGAEAESAALSCRHCNAPPFRSAQLRQEHEDKHDDQFKYDCDSCGRQFKLLSSLKSHLYRLGRVHDPKAREYACDACDKVFSSIVSKRKHYRTDHQKKSALSCGDCDQVFVDRHRLETHNKVVHLKVKDIQCTACGKLFATQERMRIHEKFVHVVEDEKVPCDVCRKEFSNKERMIDHRRSVHRDRKYQCAECGSTFKNSSTLKSHTVSIHMDADKKPLKCVVCSKGFLHESRLRAHEAIHTDEAPFSCRFCGRPNKCKNNNLKHEKRCKKATPAAAAADVPVQEAVPNDAGRIEEAEIVIGIETATSPSGT